MVRRAGDLIEAFIVLIGTGSMPTQTRTSLVAVRAINPKPRISASGFANRYRAEK